MPTTQEHDYDAAGSVHLACEKAYYFFCALKMDSETDPERCQVDRATYVKFRDQSTHV